MSSSLDSRPIAPARAARTTPSPQVDHHARVRAGVPTTPVLAEGDAGGLRGWLRRLRTSPMFWLTLALTVLYAVCLLLTYVQLTADTPVPGGVRLGLNNEAIRTAAGYALPTFVAWVVLFVWADRWRPQRPVLWWLALGWGGAVAVWVSLQVNTWAASHLAILGDGDPASGSRAAIYVAPFVEEATKGSVLFLIAILWRYRLVSKLQGLALAGLSAAAFAFSENVLYYGRVIVYSTSQIGTGDPDAALHSIVFLRGVLTAFGHPLFTTMTGIGVAVAVRTRSRIVRVVAPLVGYLVAALLHMVFNSSAGMMEENRQVLYLALSGWGLALSVTIYMVTTLLREGRLVRARLTDYVRMGWLRVTDPYQFGRLSTRLHQLLIAASFGWSTWRATLAMQRAQTELAYLRDSMVRGIVDDGGLQRERDLLGSIRDLRGRAIDDTSQTHIQWPWRRRRPVAAAQWAPPAFPGPAGIGGSFPARTGAAPLGSDAQHPPAVPPGAHRP